MVKDIKKDILWRVYLIYVVMFLFGLAIVGRIIYIQFYQGKMWREKAADQTIRFENVEAMRGNIYTCDGSLLATSIPIFDIIIDAAKPKRELSDEFFYKNIDSLTDCFARVFKDRTSRDYKQAIVTARQKGDRYYLLKRKVTYDQMNLLKDNRAYRLWKNKAVISIETKSRREMPFRLLARRTIGYQSDNAGAFVGLEGAYNDYLQGKNGERLVKKVAGNIWIPVNDENEIEPEDGADIITTIDINIQDVAESALLEQLITQDADHGCVVVMEVQTGQVVAIANIGKNKDGQYGEELNYAIGESLEPGSTFKLVSLMAALEEKKADLNDMIYVGNGTFFYHGREIKDVHKFPGGSASVRDIFQYSSNIGMSKIIINGFESNPKTFTDRLGKFGVNEALGLEIKGEVKPTIHTPENSLWSIQSLPSMATGYEVRITPLQLLTFYNAVANGGKMVRPLFVKEIRRSGQVVKVFEPVILNPAICSESTLKKVRELLQGVVEEGTASKLKNPLYKVAGKTGTAKVAANNQGYGEKIYCPSFVGYFPADKPKYSCIVTINKPSKDKYLAGEVAVPVFKVIADKVFSAHFALSPEHIKDTTKADIPPMAGGYSEEFKTICTLLQIPVMIPPKSEEWLTVLVVEENIVFKEMVIDSMIIPDLTGFGVRDAVCLVEIMGLKPEISGKGFVKEQSLLPGDTCSRGDHIRLTLAPL
ncbi:MAG: penicillin-binding protein [Bacteroidetes bacterium]|nr:penicillin-binding protein [Bacteroidota bacterium]